MVSYGTKGKQNSIEETKIERSGRMEEIWKSACQQIT